MNLLMKERPLISFAYFFSLEFYFFSKDAQFFSSIRIFVDADASRLQPSLYEGVRFSEQRPIPSPFPSIRYLQSLSSIPFGSKSIGKVSSFDPDEKNILCLKHRVHIIYNLALYIAYVAIKKVPFQYQSSKIAICICSYRLEFEST